MIDHSPSPEMIGRIEPTMTVHHFALILAVIRVMPVSSLVSHIPLGAISRRSQTSHALRCPRPSSLCHRLLVGWTGRVAPTHFIVCATTSINSGKKSIPPSFPSSNGTVGTRRSPLLNTGGLRRLPVVKSPKELADKARKVVRNVKADKTAQNAKTRARKHGVELLNALVQALCVPLRDVVRGYKSEWKRLHPFEKVVADLTARAREKKDGVTLQQQLDGIHEARKMLLDLGKEWIAKVKSAETAREAGESLGEGIEDLFACFDEFAAPPVNSILEIQRSLRSAPIVQLDTPAVVAVGCPNVGKSSIIRLLSSATPEVNNYPFTTRGMTLGHVEVFWASDSAIDIAKAVVPHVKRRPGSASNDVVAGKYAFSQLCQVMDSPGLLARPDDQRNEMEALTLASMQHLPVAVMYVMDLSGAAGDKCSSVKDQLAVRREMRSRFPRRPWIDVVSKVDLGIVEGAEEELKGILDGAPFIRLSVHEGTGVDELRMQVLRMLGEVRLVLDAMAVTE